jgi:hypothetical protein
LSASLALWPAISVFVYSSAGPFSWISFSEAVTRDVSLVDHVVSSSLTPCGAAVIHLGNDATRIEKIRVIGSDSLSQSHLDVCVGYIYQGRNDGSRPANCGRCSKCVRTILTLEILGRLDNFRPRFDLRNYNNNREALLRKLRKSNQLSDREAVALLDDRCRRRYQVRVREKIATALVFRGRFAWGFFRVLQFLVWSKISVKHFPQTFCCPRRTSACLPRQKEHRPSYTQASRNGPESHGAAVGRATYD